MISLSDDELQIIMTAAAPLHPRDRSEFLATVAAELARHPEIGAGLVARTVAKVQRKYFAAPTLHKGGKGQ